MMLKGAGLFPLLLTGTNWQYGNAKAGSGL